MSEEINIKDKLTLSIKEASMLSGIGETRLRELIKNDRRADFVMWVGSHCRIKRVPFEKYVNQLLSV